MRWLLFDFRGEHERSLHDSPTLLDAMEEIGGSATICTIQDTQFLVITYFVER